VQAARPDETEGTGCAASVAGPVGKVGSPSGPDGGSYDDVLNAFRPIIKYVAVEADIVARPSIGLVGPGTDLPFDVEAMDHVRQRSGGIAPSPQRETVP